MKAITTAIIMIGTPAIADAETYGHMMGYGYGHGLTMLFGPVLWLIVLGLVVAGVVWFARQYQGADSGNIGGRGRHGALDELDMRLARGEIEPDEYATRKKLLGG